MAELPKWVTDLTDKIAEELSNTKTVKFNTHRNRKTFTDKLIKLINETLLENVPAVRPGRQGPTVNPIHSGETKDHTIMTQSISQKGDTFLEARLAEKKAPVRTW